MFASSLRSAVLQTSPASRISCNLCVDVLCDRFLQLNHKYLRPLITGKKSTDKVHSPGAHILQVYKRLTEHDALTLSRAPTDPQELVQWNASLRNIASVLKNHASTDIRPMCVSLCGFSVMLT